MRGLAGLAGCLALAGGAWAAEHELTLTIADGALPPAQRVLRVDKGDRIRWRISSDAPGELHLHAYRLQAVVTPGKTAELAFTAFASGRFRLEWHAGTTPGPGGGGHHAPPLALLEVRPR